MQQFNLVEGLRDSHERALKLPEGMRYRDELIPSGEEAALVARIRELPFREFDFHGFKGKRRVVSFGWQYDYSGRALRKAPDIPDFLKPLRVAVATFANIEPGALRHVLVTEYACGAGIGWHRDKAEFGEVVGVSLLEPCVLRFRRKLHEEGKRGLEIGKKTRQRWERLNVLVEPRSAYHLTGPARLDWQHSIMRVDELRYSITFRTVRGQ